MAELRLVMPPEKTDALAQLRYVEAAREALRREHNALRSELDAGTLSRADWDAYLKGDFQPRSWAIDGARSEILAELKAEARASKDAVIVTKEAAFSDRIEASR